MVTYSEYKNNRKKIEKIPININELIYNNSSKVTIIVPFRDLTRDSLRTRQLEMFIRHYHDYIPKIEILIVEQSKDGRKFNRGKLLNIGFDLLKESKVDSFIFHDVDLISPESVKNLYTTIPEMPIHIANIWTEKYTFKDFLGGIISFKKDDYEKINGFPNDFWGWGGEDDALYNRLALNDIPVLQPYSDKTDNKIIGLEHPSEADSPKTKNIDKKSNIIKDLKNWKINGLNNLRYKVIKSGEYKYPNVNRVLVRI